MMALLAAQANDPAPGAELLLARAAANGDKKACRSVVAQLLTPVRNTARYLTGNDADADDAAQIAMVEILRRIGSFRGEGSLARWANRIAVRATLAHIRKGRRHAQVIQLLAEAPTKGADQPTPATESSARVVRDRICHCFDRIKEDRRATLVLRLVHGHSVKEIAKITDVPVNTVKDRLRVGRKELREKIKKDPILAAHLAEGGP